MGHSKVGTQNDPFFDPFLGVTFIPIMTHSWGSVFSDIYMVVIPKCG